MNPARWWRNVKRRKPGIYMYRTRRHLASWRSEWGYVGKSRNLDLRDKCHAGTCGRHRGCVEKPWWDLKVRRYVIRLPWWLGWDWLTLSLETCLILLLRPRYNWAKNPWPKKVPASAQALQRQARNRQPSSYRAKVELARWADRGVRALGVLIILIGIGGYLWNR